MTARTRAIKYGSWLLALAVLLVPFAVSAARASAPDLGTQSSAPVVSIDASDLSSYQASASETTEPVVLTYHDISPDSSSKYSVTPQEFADQMQMLKDAGYTSLTAAQFESYLNGGSVPQKSVLITFDDGASGLWTYADPILKADGLHAVSFLITSDVGESSYYLNWDEVQAMQSDGHWDFESHTDDLHNQVQTDEQGDTGSALTHREWLSSSDSEETMSEFTTRVTDDLQASIDAMTSHGLPKPTMFAYPFSETDSTSSDPQAAAEAQKIIDSLFTVSFTNESTPTGIAATADTSSPLPRTEVTASDTASSVFTELQKAASAS